MNSDGLSKRELQVAKLLVEGKSNKQIAQALGISEGTVEYHLTSIYNKLGVSSRVEASLLLERSGLFQDDLEQSHPGETPAPLGISPVEAPAKVTIILSNEARSGVIRRISLEEIIRFLVTYKIPIFIWILIIIITILVFMPSNKTVWTYAREGEYPDRFTVGTVLQRPAASDQMAHAQFGTIPAWPAQSGYVQYDHIETPRAEHLYLKLRYSKYSSSDTFIFVYLDQEAEPRAKILPVDQGSWEKFVWTDLIDLGKVERGVHSIKFYTDGQVYGVADLDKFTLTAGKP
jgi:DNA-binding CsgD family transcriptional regulator